jgi:hypothetical protein
VPLLGKGLVRKMYRRHNLQILILVYGNRSTKALCLGVQSAVRSTVEQVQCVPKMYSCSRILRSTFPQPWFRDISLGVTREIVAQNSTFMETRKKPKFHTEIKTSIEF